MGRGAQSNPLMLLANLPSLAEFGCFCKILAQRLALLGDQNNRRTAKFHSNKVTLNRILHENTALAICDELPMPKDVVHV
jgi:hypothetical protein